MKLPPSPPLLAKQRIAGRFFETAEMMDILSIYFGTRGKAYVHTWRYRTLIQTHRRQHENNFARKGYGADWKCITKKLDAQGKWHGEWIRDTGVAIKDEVLDYSLRGKLPLTALQKGAELIRIAEMQAVVAARVQRLLESPIDWGARMAAE